MTYYCSPCNMQVDDIEYHRMSWHREPEECLAPDGWLSAADVARAFHVPEYMLTGVHRLARPRRRIPLRRVGRML